MKGSRGKSRQTVDERSAELSLEGEAKRAVGHDKLRRERAARSDSASDFTTKRKSRSEPGSQVKQRIQAASDGGGGRGLLRPGRSCK